MVITWPCTGRRVTKHEESHLRGVTPRKNDLAVIARRNWREGVEVGARVCSPRSHGDSPLLGMERESLNPRRKR